MQHILCKTGGGDVRGASCAIAALCGGMLIMALAIGILFVPTPVHAGLPYTYHYIRDTSWGGTPSRLRPVSINASGQVCYWEENSLGREFIFVSSVNSLKTIIDSWLYPNGSLDNNFGSDNSASAVDTKPSINDYGDVAFTAHFDFSDEHSEIVRYTEANKQLTTIATGNGNLQNENSQYVVVSGSSINNEGKVAYRRRIEWLAQGESELSSAHSIMVSDGTTHVDVDNGSYSSNTYNQDVHVPMIQNNGDQLVWIAEDPPTPYSVVRRGDANTFNSPSIVDSSPYGEFFPSASISNSILLGSPLPPADTWGKVAYSDGDGVYYVRATQSPVLVADTSGDFGWIGNVAISNYGPYPSLNNVTVAFAGYLNDWGPNGPLTGVYTGPHSVNDKVLAAGDIIPSLSNQPVEYVRFGPEGMNDNGQIAMWVKFADASHAIVRADPFFMYSIMEKGLSIASLLAKYDDSSMSQRISLSPDAEDENLSFDYSFPDTNGQLTVSLGGEILTQIDAPNELLSGFTHFDMPVDISGLFPESVDELLLEFSFSSTNDLAGLSELAGLYLDNIRLGTLVNGDFGTGDLTGWESSFSEGGGVGVAVDPFHSYTHTQIVPEPRALLLALLGLALLPRRRRR